MPDKDTPLIVSSNTAEQPAYKAKVAPIGTHNGMSPSHEKVFFTTDVVPGEFMGSHYMKIADRELGSDESVVSKVEGQRQEQGMGPPAGRLLLEWAFGSSGRSLH